MNLKNDYRNIFGGLLSEAQTGCKRGVNDSNSVTSVEISALFICPEKRTCRLISSRQMDSVWAGDLMETIVMTVVAISDEA